MVQGAPDQISIKFDRFLMRKWQGNCPGSSRHNILTQCGSLKLCIIPLKNMWCLSTHLKLEFGQLQYYYYILLHIAIYYYILPHITTYCCILLHIATYYSYYYSREMAQGAPDQISFKFDRFLIRKWQGNGPGSSRSDFYQIRLGYNKKMVEKWSVELQTRVLSNLIGF